MSNRTIEEVTQNKLALQAHIEQLLAQFEEANGVKISHLYYDSMVQAIGFKHHDIEIEIRI